MYIHVFQILYHINPLYAGYVISGRVDGVCMYVCMDMYVYVYKHAFNVYTMMCVHLVQSFDYSNYTAVFICPLLLLSGKVPYQINECVNECPNPQSISPDPINVCQLYFLSY